MDMTLFATIGTAGIPAPSPNSARVVVRLHGNFGTCLIEGELVRHVGQSMVLRGWRGGEDFSGPQKIVASRFVHTAPCRRCWDHAGADAPQGGAG